MKPSTFALFVGWGMLGCGAKSINLDTGSVDPGSGSGAGGASGVPGPEWTLLAESSLDAASILVNRTRVFWCSVNMPASSSSTSGCLKDTCTSVTTFDHLTFANGATPGCYVWLAADDDNLYWSNANGLVSCPQTGCTQQPTVVSNRSAWADSLVVADGYAYWPSYVDTAILRCPLSGCNAGLQAIALNQPNLGSIAVDSTHAYWIADARSASSTIMRVAKDGGEPPVAVALRQNQATSLALDATYIYWTNTYSVGTVSRCPLAGCTGEPTILASGQNQPLGIITDGTTLYWTNVVDSYSAILVQCPVDGCGSSPTVIGSAGRGSLTIAVDETYVYWVADQARDNTSISRTKIFRRRK